MADETEAAAVSAPALPGPPRKRVRTPRLLQREAVECGAASLGIIMGYFGLMVPLEEIRAECGVSRDGSKANDVLKAARKYGLEAKGFRYDDLTKLYDLPLPVVLFWNSNHFLVLEGFGGGKAYLNDPAKGRTKVTMEELNSSYSGVLLTFAVGPNFKKGDHRPSRLRSLKARLADPRLALLCVMLCGLLLVVPGLVVPTYASRGASAVSYAYATWLFLRLLGAVYAIAFLSLGTQIKGLVGSQGILPAADYLRERVCLGPKRFRLLPTVFWWNNSDAALRAACGGGAALSLLLVAGVAPVPVLVLLWVLHLSLVTVCRLFLSYQWDVLLLEAGVLAIFLAPLEFFPTWPPASEAPAIARWLLYWLLFRLMLSSGLVKLLSGDRAWMDLTALCFHYETQPLPNRPAWYVHQFPRWFHKMSAPIMFAIELGGPILIFAPRPLSFVGAAAISMLMVLIFATGNYGFLNLLTIALCVLLVDDAAIASGMRWLLPNWHQMAAAPNGTTWPVWILAPVAALIALLSLSAIHRQLEWRRQLPGVVKNLDAWLRPFALVNSYGLSAIMTTQRNEIVIEGSNDQQHWLPYEFRWKPGDERRPPRQVAPHHPRLDWQMWFAPLRSVSRNPWLTALFDRLLTGSSDVLGLLGSNPFPGAPPRHVRARLFNYKFTTHAERRQTGHWWRRTLIGTYSRTVSRLE